ncbi:MAG: hypothetical protein M1828_004695 [Chrysothrix sp. TS-e1954]|nr:MAG: hypothetical protein M1828_004695 [Chrysothrix sp. TS-e1954]
MCSSDCLLVLLAIVFPPLPVWVKRGLCSADSLINIALCILGFFPGLLHSWYIISVTPEDHNEPAYSRVAGEDLEAGGDRNVSVYYVSHTQQGLHAQQPQPRNYGTVGPSAESGHSRSDAEVPPTYSEAIQGDNKVQTR